MPEEAQGKNPSSPLRKAKFPRLSGRRTIVYYYYKSKRLFLFPEFSAAVAAFWRKIFRALGPECRYNPFRRAESAKNAPPSQAFSLLLHPPCKRPGDAPPIRRNPELRLETGVADETAEIAIKAAAQERTRGPKAAGKSFPLILHKIYEYKQGMLYRLTRNRVFTGTGK